MLSSGGERGPRHFPSLPRARRLQGVMTTVSSSRSSRTCRTSRSPAPSRDPQRVLHQHLPGPGSARAPRTASSRTTARDQHGEGATELDARPRVARVTAYKGPLGPCLPDPPPPAPATRPTWPLRGLELLLPPWPALADDTGADDDPGGGRTHEIIRRARAFLPIHSCQMWSPGRATPTPPSPTRDHRRRDSTATRLRPYRLLGHRDGPGPALPPRSACSNIDRRRWCARAGSLAQARPDVPGGTRQHDRRDEEGNQGPARRRAPYQEWRKPGP